MALGARSCTPRFGGVGVQDHGDVGVPEEVSHGLEMRLTINGRLRLLHAPMRGDPRSDPCSTGCKRCGDPYEPSVNFSSWNGPLGGCCGRALSRCTVRFWLWLGWLAGSWVTCSLSR